VFNYKGFNRKGMTLIELLVVVSIISVLIGLLLPAVQSVREAARKTICQNNLKQLGLALHSYESAHKILPAGAYILQNDVSGQTIENSWFPKILPYLEQNTLHQKFDEAASFSSPSQQLVTEVRLSVMVCPSDSSPGSKPLESGVIASVHSYHPSSGIAPELIQIFVNKQKLTEADYRTAFDSKDNWRATNLNEVQDGLSNTVFIGEVHSLGIKSSRRHSIHIDDYIDLAGSSYDPDSVFVIHGVREPDLAWPEGLWGITNGAGGDAEYFSEHRGRINNFLFGDGSVRALSSNDFPLFNLVKLLSIGDGQQAELQ